MSQDNIVEVWNEILSVLESEISESTFRTWIVPLEPQYFDETSFVVHTGQAFAVSMLRKNHYAELSSAVKKVLGKELEIKIIFDEELAKTFSKKVAKRVAQMEKENAEQKDSVMKYQYDSLTQMQSSNLNLKYKFENFVVGESNKFAHAVAMAVAKKPAQKYNPLFIYGNSGLGKTHLMQAIGHYTLFNNSKLKVKYTKTEDYVNDFISNSRNSKDTIENMSKFNKKYTNIDIILIDDIQFIESKNKTMAQMQHTFDSLYNKGKQIVITSDRLPKEIPTLTSALCSRFEMGLMVELTPPDLDTRIEIIKKLASDNDLKYTEEALRYIAVNFTQNVRELEGAFNKVCAYAEITEQELDLKLAKEVLKCNEIDTEISFEKIAQVTAHYYGIEINDLKGTARGQKISTARHMAVYLSRELTQKSFVSIAEFYNKKHTTIMFAHEKIKKEIITNNDLSLAAREIRQALKVL